MVESSTGKRIDLGILGKYEFPGYYPPEIFQVNERPVKLFPCRHILDEVAPGSIETYELAIADADAVLVEGAPHCLGLVDKNGKVPEAFLAALINEIEKYPLKPSITKEQIIDQIKASYEGSRGDFFSKLEEIAAQQQKPIFCVDPFDLGNIKESTHQFYNSQHYEKRLAQMAALFLTIGAGDFLFSSLQSYREKKVITHPYSRRDVLRGIAAVIGTTLTASAFSRERDTLVSTIMSDGQDYAMGGRGAGILPQFVADLSDFRDAGSAQGLDFISQTMGTDQSMVGFWGAMHVPGIHFYSNHAIERAARLKLYQPVFGSVDMSTIKKFVFDQSVQEWRRVDFK